MHIILYIHIYQCGEDVYKLHQLAAPQALVCEAGNVEDKGGVCCDLQVNIIETGRRGVVNTWIHGYVDIDMS